MDLDDLNPESLWKFRVRGFGPLLVAMDSAGGSLYADSTRDARARRAAVLATLGVDDQAMTRAACGGFETDLLVLGSGGAGLFAALHAHDADPHARRSRSR